MRILSLRFTLVLAAVAMACAPADDSASSASQEPCTLAPADIETIQAMRATHEAELLAADWETMIASHSPEVVLMPPNLADIVGHEAVLDYVKAFPPMKEVALTFEEVDGCGDLAYVWGRYSIAMQPPESAELVRDTGRWIWILRKNPEGRWIVTLDISNSNLPIVAPPE